MSADAKNFLDRSVRYLLGDPCASLMVARTKTGDWLEEFLRRLNSASDAAGMLKVAFVGEFKAGKSSLVNAILRREVAYVDTFEASTSVAVISPGADERAVVNQPAGGQQVLSIDAFVTSCKRREFAGVDRVELTVNHALPLVLIDTPGMGSVTGIHEGRAESAVMDIADLVVWVMDPNDLLSAREGAFLKRARSIGLPVWCVLSKADDFSPGELDECIEYVVQSTGIERADVMALSAHTHLGQGSDPGVCHLIDRLLNASGDTAGVHQRADSAKDTELLAELSNALALISTELQREVDWVRSEESILVEEARIVKSTLVADTESILAEETGVFLESRLPKLIDAHTTVDRLCRIVLECFAAERLPSVAVRIARRVHEKAVAIWDKQFEDRSADLCRQIERLTSAEIQDKDSQIYLQEQMLISEERRAAVKHGLGAVPAALGAGALTLLFDPTGITANALAMLIGAVSGHLAGRGVQEAFGTSRSEVVARMNDVTAFADQMAECIVSGLLAAEVEQYVDNVVEQALDERCKRRLAGLSRSHLDTSYAVVAGIGIGVANVMSTGDTGELSAAPGQSGSEEPGTTQTGNQSACFAREPGSVLARIIQDHGPDICGAPKRVEGLLRDLAGTYPREIHLLILCLTSGAVDRIQHLRKSVPADMLVGSVALDLQTSMCIDVGAAEWAVVSWCNALGVHCSAPTHS